METRGVRVLVVDDETQILKLLRVALTGHGYQGPRGCHRAGGFKIGGYAPSGYNHSGPWSAGY